MISRLFALRYLFSRNSRSVINIIAGVSIAAVAVPVAAMIVLLSVFNGFEGIIRDLRSAFDADIAVLPARGAVFAVSELPKSLVTGIEGVEAASYVIEQSAMAGYGGRRTVASIRGVDDDYPLVLPARETVTTGEFEVQRGEIEQIVLGQGLAYALGVHSYITDDVVLYAVRRNSFSTLLPVDGWSAVSLAVGGLFAIDADTDGSTALVSIDTARRLFDYPDSATALLVKLSDENALTTAKERVGRVVGDSFRVVTRDEANASLYRIMRYEKWGIFIIALLVLIIASLSIVGVLVMLIIEKRRDIETLSAVGADRSLLRSIFRAEGVLICTIGGAGGMVLGVVLCLIQQHFGVITIPSASLLVSTYPVELHLSDVAVTAAAFAAVVWAISSATAASMIKNVSYTK